MGRAEAYETKPLHREAALRPSASKCLSCQTLSVNSLAINSGISRATVSDRLEPANSSGRAAEAGQKLPDRSDRCQASEL